MGLVQINLSIDAQDEFLYCGTRQGDIFEILLQSGRYKRTGAVRRNFEGSISTICSHFNSIFIGLTTGAVAKVDKLRLNFEDELNLGKGSI